MSTFNIRTPNSRFDLIASRIKYGTDGGINVDSGALYVNGANGRVGINNTSPTVTLDISGTIRASGGLVTSTGNYDISGYYQVNGTPINTQFYPSLGPNDVSHCLTKFSARGANIARAGPGYGYVYDLSGYTGPYILVPAQAANTACQASYDGVNWFTVGNTPTNRAANITGPTVFGRDLSGNNVFCTYNNNDNNSVPAAISVTKNGGFTWTDISQPFNGSMMGKVVYSPELRIWVASGRDGNSTFPGGLFYSTDVINWTEVTSLANLVGSGLEWSPQLGYFICLNSTNPATTAYISRDGINWTANTLTGSRPNGANFQTANMCWSPQLGIFCCMNFASNQISYTSTDGINWQSWSTGLVLRQDVQQIVWSPQLGCFIYQCGTSFGSGIPIGYSFNGRTWRPVNFNWQNGVPSIRLRGIAWCNEIGTFVASNLTGNANGTTFVASLAGRIPTSTNVFDSSLNNINENGLWNFQSLGRGVPVTKTNPVGNAFTVQPGENWIIVNNSAATTTVTLPPAASWAGEEIMIKNTQAQLVNSASSNVVPLIGGAAGTSILSANAGRWATLVSDGTNWVIMNGVI